jgi:cardiolipin synthase
MLILSDFLDGYFARKFNQVTELGIVLDPIADKIIMAVGLVMLILYRDFPIPIVIFLIYRDIMIVVIGWFTLRKINKPVMANLLGKLNTFIFAIAGFLSVIKIDNVIFTFVIICAYIMTLASGISYGLIGARLLFNKPMQKTLYWIGIAILTAIVIYFSLNFTWI